MTGLEEEPRHLINNLFYWSFSSIYAVKERGADPGSWKLCTSFWARCFSWTIHPSLLTWLRNSMSLCLWFEYILATGGLEKSLPDRLLKKAEVGVAMARAPCCDKMGLKKGPWTPKEDQILVAFVQKNGHGNWRALPKLAGNLLINQSFSNRAVWDFYVSPIKKQHFSCLLISCLWYAGLQRCGKSCRLRWMNYLRPDIKRGNFSRGEEDAIIELHEKLGNR